MSNLAFLVLSFAVFLTACEDPAANKPKATTTNSTTFTPAANPDSVKPVSAPNPYAVVLPVSTPFTRITAQSSAAQNPDTVTVAASKPAVSTTAR